MTENKGNHHSVAITTEAYELLTTKAEIYNTDRKAIASEAIINLFQERTLLLRMKGGIALALAAGVLIGAVIL
jgi:hypothetical protein